MLNSLIKQNLFGPEKGKRIQALIFLVIWPWLNILIITTMLSFLDLLTLSFFLQVAGKMWSVFFAGFLLYHLIETLFEKPLKGLFGKSVWLCRPVLILSLFPLFAPIVDIPVGPDAPVVKILPLIVVLLETLIYVAVMFILQQQESYYQSQLSAQQAELQVLKMQSNPHFLFNTLNLIANEVNKHPEKAKELIYNLSDLLRDTVSLAKQQWASIEAELRLMELYLLLHQKRFEGRLTFDIDCPSDLNPKLVPSLLLLPVVENAIKHGVAPYAKNAHVSIHVELHDGYLCIEVLDTGEPFDTEYLQHGEGLRILKETLKLHFAGDFSMVLSSELEGANMKLRFPQANFDNTKGR